MINVKVKAAQAEGNANLLRRFTKRVQGAKILPKAKSGRFRERELSTYVKKKNKLKSLEKRAKIQKMLKLGYNPKSKKRR